VIKREKILEDVGGKLRNVVEGPDGYLYVSVDGKGIFKLIKN
jgi:glucose/arabinose dehydrogenase